MTAAPSRGVAADLPALAARFAEGRDALAGLASGLAEELVARGWPQAEWDAPVSPGGGVHEWPGQWWGAHVARPAEPYTTARFDWVLWGFGSQGGGDRPRFGTGMVWSHWRRDHGPNPLDDRAWVAEMLSLVPGDRWGRFDAPDRYDGIRLYRSVDLDRVAAEPLLGGQVELLADLAASTFSLLEAHPPPTAGSSRGSVGPS
jgi:hypothetical protein